MFRLVSSKILPSAASTVASLTPGGVLATASQRFVSHSLQRLPAMPKAAILRPVVSQKFKHLHDPSTPLVAQHMVFYRFYSDEADDNDSKKKKKQEEDDQGDEEADKDVKDPAGSKGRRSKAKVKKPSTNGGGEEEDSSKKQDEILSPENEEMEGMIARPNNKALLQPSVPENYPQVLAIPIAKRPIFPHGIHQIHLTDQKVISSLRALHKTGQGYAGIFLTKDDSNESDIITDIAQVHRVGTFNSIVRIDTYDNATSVIMLSHRRIWLENIIKTDPYVLAQVQNLKDEPYKRDNVVIQAYTQEIIATVKDIAKISTFFRENFAHAQYTQNLMTRSLLDDPALLADFVTNLTSATSNEKQDVLESLVIEERLKKALLLLKKELLNAKVQSDLSKDVEKKISDRQREYFLHEQLKSIKKELGLQKDDKDALITKFKEKAAKKAMPEAVKKVFDEEIAKLSLLEGSSAEFNVTRNYLDWLSELPWGILSTENLDVGHAQTILDEDHYGLRDVKDRILEFIAVGKLRGTVQGKILCLVGPPGVGKTSIGKSIARTLQREFFRFSVGGLHDVAEIKGHRRTYIGAMPGKMVQCLKKTQTENPLVLMDEIDKIGKGYNGDPSSALLEMLDPEQNASFLDHYLDVPVDLSKVLFVCTANTLDTIPGPLLDRMEVIRLSGYIEEEKFQIAQKYLVPVALKNCGLKPEQIQVEDEVIRTLIHSYCRESGVRNLQKHIDKIYRKAAFKIVQGSPGNKVVVTEANLKDFVGNPIFVTERTYDTNPAGVITGLAWTVMGGSTLYIESAVDKAAQGKNGLSRTGQLGEVMSESSSIAYTFAKGFVKEVDPANTFFESANIHMHVPDGATKKDGPSAGITMTSSLLSLALNRPPAPDVAMTGEITLLGKVLRIGGVKEKVIAAKRSGIRTIILPLGNKADWDELEDHIKEGLTVHLVENYKEVFPIVFPATGS